MNCPSCGKEMERGILYTERGRGLFFLPPGEAVRVVHGTTSVSCFPIYIPIVSWRSAIRKPRPDRDGKDPVLHFQNGTGCDILSTGF